MADDRAVLLQAPPEEDLLPGRDVLAGEDDLAAGVDDALRHGHRVGVGAERQQTHDEEPEDHHERDAWSQPLLAIISVR